MDVQTAQPEAATESRLKALRAEIKQRGLAGFIVPLQDEHQGEEVPAHARRLTWLTGFSGSAGLAIVLADQAAIFVDGRYTLQVREQTNTELFTPLHVSEDPPAKWIAKHLDGGKLGFDPWLHSPASKARFDVACTKSGGTLEAVSENPIDAVWNGRPPPPDAAARVHEVEFSGESSAEKRGRIAAGLVDDGLDAAVLTLPDSIAWLLNIRGDDLVYAPVALAFAIINKDSTAELFIDPGKITADVRAHLSDEVSISARDEFVAALESLGKNKACVLADSRSAPVAVFDHLEKGGADVTKASDPCQLPKACKNDVELSGNRAAHHRDGAALTELLCWLDLEAAGGEIDELAVIAKSDGLRLRQNNCTGLSFPAITGAGPNGAIIHYRASEKSNRRLTPGELFLLDSGGQYRDGTTDVTRTIAVGDAGKEEQDRFTRVLKGHIALATARFPVGTTGSQLDILARRALWDIGLDYDHGTGHGVGSYLNVHEGPQRISKIPNAQALMPGMIVSDEPGYYKEGAYGIRIENLLAVREAEANGGDRPLLEFETLTLAPLDRKLIDTALLTQDEIDWLDAYHARVRDALSASLDAKTTEWLAGVTAPLGA